MFGHVASAVKGIIANIFNLFDFYLCHNAQVGAQPYTFRTGAWFAWIRALLVAGWVWVWVCLGLGGGAGATGPACLAKNIPPLALAFSQKQAGQKFVLFIIHFFVRCKPCYHSTYAQLNSLLNPYNVWVPFSAATPTRSPAKVCDIQRPNGYRPHSKLCCMACSTSGRIMWSVGRNLILLWDTYTGRVYCVHYVQVCFAFEDIPWCVCWCCVKMNFAVIIW
jgi:hypothetical protein